jgi:hypothetical protein
MAHHPDVRFRPEEERHAPLRARDHTFATVTVCNPRELAPIATASDSDNQESIASGMAKSITPCMDLVSK